MIWTSNFARAEQVKEKERLLNIAQYMPEGIEMESYPDLMPPADMLQQYKQDHNEAAFVKAYQEQVLDRLSVAKVAKDLKGRILTCYENPGDFCHRHLVAEWLQKHGFKCQEL